MTSRLPEPAAPLEAQRQRVVEALTVHFASDRIDAAEFEARLDRVYRAQSLQELESVSADLPVLPAAAAGATPVTMLAGTGERRDSQLVAALLGGTERKGSWIPARRINAMAVMGGVDLDFREARFAPGVTELNVFALLGGVDIVVPPGLRVECEGIGVLGGFDGQDQPGAPQMPDQPTLRIRGLALLGGVDITERLPGESARDRKRRLRDERKQRGRIKPGG